MPVTTEGTPSRKSQAAVWAAPVACGAALIAAMLWPFARPVSLQAGGKRHTLSGVKVDASLRGFFPASGFRYRKLSYTWGTWAPLVQPEAMGGLRVGPVVYLWTVTGD